VDSSFSNINQIANYMPEHHKTMDRLISKHYDYLGESVMHVGEAERQIIGNSCKNFVSAGKTCRPQKPKRGGFNNLLSNIETDLSVIYDRCALYVGTKYRTHLKNVFWPPAFWRDRCLAAILNQNPIFEMGSR
jgi:hypothetical protein